MLTPLLYITRQEMEKDENFKVILLEASGGGKLGRIKKTVVTIVNDDGELNRISITLLQSSSEESN